MDLTYKEKLGQRFIVGLDVNEINDNIEKLITNYFIGGVVLYKSNYSSYEEMIEFTNKLKKINQNNKIPLFIAIDQEGGRVNRLPKDIKNISAPMKLVRKNNIKKLIELTTITANILKNAGVNMNFAPVLDIKRFEDNHPIGDRCYGENYIDVIHNGVEVMKELNKNEIIAVIKHFPGHGITKNDTHYFLPKIEKYSDFKNDLIPFECAISNKADAIMIGHFLIKDINKKYPIAFDKNFIRENIRKKYNYDGLIITDDIKMKGVYFYKQSTLITKALNADNDLIMIKYKDGLLKQLNDIYNTYNGNMDKNIERIVKIKNKYKINDNINYNELNIKEINKKIENLLKEG